ncbi:MAG: hypothetical protein ACU84J_14215 [Gammaproteobacteria bacterium]
MSTEPVLATEFLPIAWVLVSVFLDALITVDLDTLEPTTLIEPVLALEFLPIAWVLVNVFFEALIKVDFSILEPAAIEALLKAANKATVATVNVFMMFFLLFCFFDWFLVYRFNESFAVKGSR